MRERRGGAQTTFPFEPAIALHWPVFAFTVGLSLFTGLAMV